MNESKLRSVAITPDGNRTYAKKEGISIKEAYPLGIQKAKEALLWSKDYPSIKFVSFYTLSLENLRRSKTELSILINLFADEIESSLNSDFFHKNKIKPVLVGRLDLLPKKIQDLNERLKKNAPEDYDLQTNILIAYTGRQEIVDAARHMALNYKAGQLTEKDFTQQNFNNYLYENFPNPDLVFRTKTHRMSGLLTYQTAYSELYFLDKLWPEVQKQDFANAVQYYNESQRNFGH